jgi:hypothetical protein
MSLSESSFEELLPSYLTSTEKGRLQNALNQFFKDEYHEKEKVYTDFYLKDPPSYLLQSDMLHSVKGIGWDEEKEEYRNGYYPVILISNTCDVSDENLRGANVKQVMFAPIIPVSEYISDLEAAGYNSDQTKSFYSTLKNQNFTNLFYLPPKEPGNQDYMAFLDKIFWQPISMLKAVTSDINNNRFASLSHFGFYLFITKISFHLCRVPEEYDRVDLSSQLP